MSKRKTNNAKTPEEPQTTATAQAVEEKVGGTTEGQQPEDVVDRPAGAGSAEGAVGGDGLAAGGHEIISAVGATDPDAAAAGGEQVDGGQINGGLDGDDGAAAGVMGEEGVSDANDDDKGNEALADADAGEALPGAAADPALAAGDEADPAKPADTATDGEIQAVVLETAAGDASAQNEDGEAQGVTDTPASDGLRFTKRPVTIEAWQFVLPDEAGLVWATPRWLVDAFEAGVAWFQGGDEPYITINTLEGDHRADPGDFIIRGVKGELYPCKPNIFELTYVPADDAKTGAAGGDGVDAGVTDEGGAVLGPDGENWRQVADYLLDWEIGGDEIQLDSVNLTVRGVVSCVLMGRIDVPNAVQTLGLIGLSIRVGDEPGDIQLVVPRDGERLRSRFAGTVWSDGTWWHALLQAPADLTTRAAARVNGVNWQCLLIKVLKIDDEREEPAINEAPTEREIAGEADMSAAYGRASRPSMLAELDANLMTAMFAAGGTYGSKREGRLAVDLNWLQTSMADCEKALKVAAEFLRANRDATPETLTIQLRLKGIRGAPAPVGLVEIAWRVFAFTLNALDAHDQAERDAAAAAEKAEQASRPRGAFAGQLAAKPASRNLLQPTQIARVHGHRKPAR